MKLQEVESKFLQFVGYDDLNKHLRVMIKSKIYDHYEVPREVWDEFMKSESKGKYYNQKIRGKYQ
jgi:hypothetical protein